MGVFGFAEIMQNLEKKGTGESFLNKVTTLIPAWTDIKRMTPSILRGTTIGSILGILPGGGAALYHCSKDINEPKGDEQLGYAIVMKACKSPMEAILKNAGLDHNKVFGLLDANYTSDTSMGYDVVSEQLVNMIEKGVIDPTKVTRTAIEKAVSVAGTLLTTECMIVEEPAEKESEPKS
jgi:chaperonin GroEL (HSP60 family)